MRWFLDGLRLGRWGLELEVRGVYKGPGDAFIRVFFSPIITNKQSFHSNISIATQSDILKTHYPT
jgi:hypothetical protein